MEFKSLKTAINFLQSNSSGFFNSTSDSNASPENREKGQISSTSDQKTSAFSPSEGSYSGGLGSSTSPSGGGSSSPTFKSKPPSNPTKQPSAQPKIQPIPQPPKEQSSVNPEELTKQKQHAKNDQIRTHTNESAKN